MNCRSKDVKSSLHHLAIRLVFGGEGIDGNLKVLVVGYIIRGKSRVETGKRHHTVKAQLS